MRSPSHDGLTWANVPPETPAKPAYPADSRLARRKQMTRQKILDVAVELFVTQGYEQTTIDQIAERADIARTTFFNHFPGKEDVTHAWVGDWRSELRATIAEQTQRQPADKLRAAYEQIARDFDADSATRRPMIAIWVRCGGPFAPGREDTPMFLGAQLDEAKRAGLLHQDVDTAACGLLITDAFIGARCRWAAPPDDSIRPHLEPLFTLVLPLLVPAQDS